MARPPKEKAERKDTDLRIPVTESQKELVMRAAQLAGLDMAAWARPLLLKEAQALVDQENGRRTRSK